MEFSVPYMDSARLARKVERRALGPLNTLQPLGEMALSPQERKGFLMMAGKSQRQIAEGVGVSTALVSLVINGLHRHERIEREIARSIGRAAMDVFPPDPGRQG